METTMYALLATAKANNASDLHITVGVRPKCRISGTLYEMQGFDVLTPAKTKELVESMFNAKHRPIPCQRLSSERLIRGSTSYCRNRYSNTGKSRCSTGSYRTDKEAQRLSPCDRTDRKW